MLWFGSNLPLIIQIICGKPPRKEKNIYFQNKRRHNLESLKLVHRKIGTLSDILLLRNYGKICSFSIKR